MARSFANAKLFSAVVADGFSNALTRRGYAAAPPAATQGVATRGGAAGKMAKKAGEESVATTEKVAWVPDPKTGFYKPENSREIDVADLRATLLGRKFNN